MMSKNRYWRNKGCNVHVWKYCLADSKQEASLAWLSFEEKHVLGRLKKYEDKRQYILAHTFLRRVIEFYTHLPSDQLQFDEGLNGKPALKCRHSHSMVHFSLSHRHDYALLAISDEPCVGIDVEEVKPVEDFFSFLVDHFSKHERKLILAESTEPKKLSMLFRLWAMKEAVVKALSVGFYQPLKKVEVPAFLKTSTSRLAFDSLNAWCIGSIPVAKNYKGAFGVRGEKVITRFFDYNETILNQVL